MARRELAPAALRVARAVAELLPDGDVVVGCSGGADSTALAMGAQWAVRRTGGSVRALVVDHGLQADSARVAGQAVARLRQAGVEAVSVPVSVEPAGEGIEAAARTARLAALAASGLPVLLGHTMDDQAESVLLGLVRGSGARSLAGMAAVRGQFIRPLLGLRRCDTVGACRAWGVRWWDDPMNDDTSYARVRARALLAELHAGLGRDLAPALARTAVLARADADLLEALAVELSGANDPSDCRWLAAQPDALRWRVLHRWLTDWGAAVGQRHVFAVDALVTRWHGQGPVPVPGGEVRRVEGHLCFARLATGGEPV